MKYILIANNPLILDSEVNKLELEKDDVIILFNHQYPFKWLKFINHPNKILFIRLFGWGFTGLRKTLNTIDNFQKIIPYSKYKYDENHIKNITIKKIGSSIENKLEIIQDKMQELIKTLNYPANQDPTLGFIAYLYLKHLLKTDSKIILFGFTMVYDGKLGTGPCHAWNFEVEYYKNELLNNNNLIKIDGVDTTKKYPLKKLDEKENKNTNINKLNIFNNNKYSKIKIDLENNNTNIIENKIKPISNTVRDKKEEIIIKDNSKNIDNKIYSKIKLIPDNNKIQEVKINKIQEIPNNFNLKIKPNNKKFSKIYYNMKIKK